MLFQPSAEKIKDVLKRRVLSVAPSLKVGFPSIFAEKSLQWLLFGDEHLFGVVFISDTQKGQIADFVKR
ncbi:MAG: hypothetical protein Q8M56_01795, partial [Desulfobacterales bacterium]|nr:hypothetical protein [Desulfobacterales bacterium]